MQLEIERLNNMYGDRHDKWKSQMLRAEAAESRLEAMEEVVEAVNWLMGCNGEFEKPDGAHPYWWRSEFAKRVGLVYDGTKYVLGSKKEVEG